MLQQVVISTLETRCQVRSSQKLLLGFSGGPDSVCLLDVLSKSSYAVAIAYFDHQLREHSRDEVEFARWYAEKYSIQFFTGSEQINALAEKDGIGVETCARKYRYRFLAEIANEFGAEVIVVAHHADDQVETVLMNIVRGSGLNGLAGMPFSGANEYTGQLPVARPMLDIWKDEILSYCAAYQLEYLIDHTNFNSDYTRNKLRNQIIPELEKINSSVKENILRMRNIISAEHDYLESLTFKSYCDVVEIASQNMAVFNLARLTQYAVSMQRRIIIKALQEALAVEKDIRYQMVEDIRALFTFAIESKQLQINDQLSCLVEGGIGYIYTDIQQLPRADAFRIGDCFTDLYLPIPGCTKINRYWQIFAERFEKPEFVISHDGETQQFTAYLDADKVDESLVIRRKESGDRYSPLGMDNHSMKVSNFWINKKIPKRKRHDWPLVSDSNRIVWIPGFQPAHAVRVTESTRAVLKIMIEKIDF